MLYVLVVEDSLASSLAKVGLSLTTFSVPRLNVPEEIGVSIERLPCPSSSKEGLLPILV